MNKKGITFKAMLVLITMSLSLVVLVVVFNILFEGINKDTEKKLCSSSVYANHLMHVKGVSISSDDINCPTEYYTENSKKPEEIKRNIAQKMVDCWDVYGKGEYKLFSEDQVYCSICTVIDFKHKDINVGNLEEFMANAYPDKKKVTFMDYLLGYETLEAKKYINDKNIFDKTDSKLDNQINTNQKYSIVYVHAKGRTGFSELKDFFGGPKTSSVIFGIGAGGIGTGAVTVLPIILFGSNPVGWVAGATIGLVVGGYVGFKTFFTGEDDHHLAFILLKEHSLTEFDDLKCHYYPAVQKQYTERN
jgi:hypothetical protein